MVSPNPNSLKWFSSQKQPLMDPTLISPRVLLLVGQDKQPDPSLEEYMFCGQFEQSSMEPLPVAL
jgi:hypothetical protein